VRSTWLQFVGLESDGTLVIAFRSGRWVRYPTTQPYHFAEFLGAASPGAWLDRFYRKKRPWVPYAPGIWLPGLFNTGQDDIHLAVSSSHCVNEIHYVSGAGQAKCPSDAVVEAAILSGASLMHNSQLSRWVSHQCDMLSSDGDAWTYTLTVNVQGINPARLKVSFQYAASQDAKAYLNGTLVYDLVNNLGIGFQSVDIGTPSGNGDFTAGANTISFDVLNRDATTGGFPWSGLRVEFTDVTLV
jgi:hypothetical protein